MKTFPKVLGLMLQPKFQNTSHSGPEILKTETGNLYVNCYKKVLKNKCSAYKMILGPISFVDPSMNPIEVMKGIFFHS